MRFVWQAHCAHVTNVHAMLFVLFEIERMNYCVRHVSCCSGQLSFDGIAELFFFFFLVAHVASWLLRGFSYCDALHLVGRGGSQYGVERIASRSWMQDC